MAEHFLHGVEIIELDSGTRPITTVASSVIGLVGTAPQGAVNKPTLILGSRSEAVEAFGTETEGFTIPAALSAIFDQTGAMVVVVNVADPNNTAHISSIEDQTYTFNENGKIYLGKCGITGLSVSDGEDDYKKNTDYVFNASNNVVERVATGDIEEGASVVLSFSYLDPTKILLSDVVGGVNTDGTYKGAQCLLTAQTECKVQPRLLIAPGFTHEKPESGANPVVSELLNIAERMRAIVIADCPNGTKEEAVAFRETISSSRAYIAYPWARVLKDGVIVEEPFSARIAGVIAKSDNDKGFWWSPSNNVINGIVGLSKPIDFTLGDPVCVANYLNENKVATIIQQDGFRLWGNRTTSADVKWCFISVRRTADMINDSLLRAHLWAVDRNITKTYCENVCEGVNNYLRYLKNIGAVIGGNCWADSSLNTPDQISQGKIIFDFDFTPPYPAEHITFRSRLVGDYLEEINITKGNNNAE